MRMQKLHPKYEKQGNINYDKQHQQQNATVPVVEKECYKILGRVCCCWCLHTRCFLSQGKAYFFFIERKIFEHAEIFHWMYSLEWICSAHSHIQWCWRSRVVPWKRNGHSHFAFENTDWKGALKGFSSSTKSSSGSLNIFSLLWGGPGGVNLHAHCPWVGWIQQPFTYGDHLRGKMTYYPRNMCKSHRRDCERFISSSRAASAFSLICYIPPTHVCERTGGFGGLIVSFDQSFSQVDENV